MKDVLPPDEIPCPQCGDTMTEGFVTSNVRIGWLNSGDKDATSVWSTETLTPGSIWKWFLPKLPAIRCTKCALVLMRYKKS